jgi:hypothetical protein
MHWAAMQGALDVLDFLLAQGANPDANDPDPASGLIAYPLHWAAINGRLMFCKVLLDSGAQVDTRGGELNATPMMWAAKYSLPPEPPRYIVRTLMEGTDMCILCIYYFNMAGTHYLPTRRDLMFCILRRIHRISCLFYIYYTNL